MAPRARLVAAAAMLLETMQRRQCCAGHVSVAATSLALWLPQICDTGSTVK